MKVVVDLGNLPIWKRSRNLALAVRPLLEATVTINCIYLQTHRVPPLYKAGVRYQNEPEGQPYEDFAIVPAIIARGWGDCDDLASWRVAELRMQGEKAKIRIQWRKYENGRKLYHVVVRRANGDIEDPSRILGMGAENIKLVHKKGA